MLASQELYFTELDTVGKCVHKCLSVDAIPSKFHAVNLSTTYFSEIIVNIIIFHHCTGSPNRLMPAEFLIKILCSCVSLVYAASPTQLSLLDVINLTVLCEQHKL
jgi:predicted metal-binding protein